MPPGQGDDIWSQLSCKCWFLTRQNGLTGRCRTSETAVLVKTKKEMKRSAQAEHSHMQYNIPYIAFIEPIASLTIKKPRSSLFSHILYCAWSWYRLIKTVGPKLPMMATVCQSDLKLGSLECGCTGTFQLSQQSHCRLS